MSVKHPFSLIFVVVAVVVCLFLVALAVVVIFLIGIN